MTAAADTRHITAGDTGAMQLALFDLDHTLLSADSDQLWCDFLIDEAMLDTGFRACAEAISARYSAGTIAPPEYSDFFASVLRGHSMESLRPLRERFLREAIRPLIPDDARSLLQRHREAGDTLVLTTATNRVVSELTAKDLGVNHYLCTELESVDGRFTGRAAGVPNMGTGKLQRLREWLAAHGRADEILKRASFYSDSINDLALLSVVGRPTVVDPDPRLELAARRKGWRVIRFQRGR